MLLSELKFTAHSYHGSGVTWWTVRVRDRDGKKIDVYKVGAANGAYPEGYFYFAIFGSDRDGRVPVVEPLVAQCLLYEWGCKPCT